MYESSFFAQNTRQHLLTYLVRISSIEAWRNKNMSDDAKSIDIKLYSLAKVEAAFDEIVAADEQPATDIIAAMKNRIQEHLDAGKSIAWAISVLQRSGIKLGSRQIRTYLQRAGIGGGAKRTAKGCAGRSARKPKVADVQEADGGIGSPAGRASAVNVQETCSGRAVFCAQVVQSAQDCFKGVPVEDVKPVPAVGVQDTPASDVSIALQDGPVPVQDGVKDVPATGMQSRLNSVAGGLEYTEGASDEPDKMAAYNRLRQLRGGI